MQQSSLDKLKIEREPEKASSGRSWWLVIAGLVIVAAGIGWMTFKTNGAVEVRTAVARELSAFIWELCAIIDTEKAAAKTSPGR